MRPAPSNRASIATRLSKLEAQLAPPQRNPALIVEEPSAGSPEPARAEFEATLQKALDAQRRVFVVTQRSLEDLRRSPVQGISYFATEWEAQLALLYEAPSREGRDCLLRDVFAEVLRRNTIFRPSGSAVANDTNDGDGGAGRRRR